MELFSCFLLGLLLLVEIMLAAMAIIFLFGGPRK